MKFIDDATRDDLAKSSTILQCILAILDFECHRYSCQPEVIGVEKDEAMVNVEALRFEEMIEVCNSVNKQFTRKDKASTCFITNDVDGFISCRAGLLDEYDQLN